VTDIHKRLGVAQAANAWGSGPFTYTLVTKSWFEGGIAAIIVLNVFVMAAQIQYRSFDLGRTIGYRWHDETKEELWAHADVVFNVLDFVFGVIYIAEFLLKVHAFRSVWIKDPWNWFDALIVGFWVVEKQMQDVVQLPGNVTLLRTARLFKLLRLVKVIKTIHGFESLALLLTTLRACVKILAWSSTLLFSFQVLIAFVIFFVLEETYFLQPGVTFEEQRQVFEYFGSFSRVMLSMFEMTLANWPPVCRLLVENINEWFMIFFVTHKLIIGFAVIGVINGVFMQETLKVASSDDAIMMRTKEQEVKTYSRKIQRLFYAADASHDGKIDVQEFVEIVADPQILTWLSSMDLPVRDPELLFNLLDSEGCGKISMEVLVKNALKLRGSAKSVDVLGLKKQLDAIQNSLALAMDGKVHA
jgi:voltage-gated sodium channel